jgi:putative transposase
MKLTKKKVKYLIRWKERGKSSREIGIELHVSKRRVNQVWKEYIETGEIPEIGKNLGRPRKEITEEEGEMVLEAKKKYKLGARRLEPIIERDYGVHIPHNHIHRILLEMGLAEENPKKKKRRKWIRYERKHSLSAAHMDWHDGINGKKVCAILDDSSRKILTGREFEHEYEKNSIAVFEDLVHEYWEIMVLRELIIDNGSQFGAHRTDDKGEWNSEFKRIVEGYGTKIIRTRVNHPQTNGKLEKWNDTYEKARGDFESFEDFIFWYNNVRPHESLGWKHNDLETPEEAFWRKLPEECKFGVAVKLFDW